MGGLPPIQLAGLQELGDPVGIEDDAGRRCCRVCSLGNRLPAFGSDRLNTATRVREPQTAINKGRSAESRRPISPRSESRSNARLPAQRVVSALGTGEQNARTRRSSLLPVQQFPGASSGSAAVRWLARLWFPIAGHRARCRSSLPAGVRRRRAVSTDLTSRSARLFVLAATNP